MQIRRRRMVATLALLLPVTALAGPAHGQTPVLAGYTADSLDKLDAAEPWPLERENGPAFDRPAPAGTRISLVEPEAAAMAAPAEFAGPSWQGPDGPVVLRDAFGRVEGQGDYVQRRPHGPWTRWYFSDTALLVREAVAGGFEAPLRAELTLRAGQPEGPCTLVDSRGRLVARVELRAGRPHGLSRWHRPDGGVLREGHYREGRRHGQQLASGAEAAPVRWAAGRRLDRYQPSAAADQPSVSGWVLAAEPVEEQALDWWGGAWRPRIVERPKTPLRHGEWVWRYPSGQRQGRGTFELGQEQGHWIVWHPSGRKQTEGNYRNGSPVGLWRRWDERGQLVAQQSFPTPGAKGSAAVVASHLEAEGSTPAR